MPEVDIIIRGKNGNEMVNSLLVSIAKNTPRELYRVILVDDGSDQPLAGDVEFLLRCDKSSGAVTATNLGLGIALQQSDSKYVLVMDNDTEIPQGDDTWLQRMIAELEEFPDTAAVGATSDRVNRPQQILATPQTYTGKWEGGVADNPPSIWFVSFCVLLKKSAIRAVGLWDERYNPGNWEDTDYAVQLRNAGYTVRVARSVYVHHHCHKTFGDDLQQLMRTNQEKFLGKWGLGRLWDLGIVPHEEFKEIVTQTTV